MPLTSYVALLRGINVGGKGILPMKSLTAILENLGCTEVATYIQSGNVVFSHAVLDPEAFAQTLTDQIETLHGFRPQAMILSKEAFEACAAANPYPTHDGKALHLFFLEGTPSAPELEKLAGFQADSESFTLNGRCFYLHTPEGFGRSKLSAKIEKHMGIAATARNWNTVEKLLQMLSRTVGA